MILPINKLINEIEIDNKQVPEKSVSVIVLAEPAPGSPIRADIIFLHGIHGCLMININRKVY